MRAAVVAGAIKLETPEMHLTSPADSAYVSGDEKQFIETCFDDRVELFSAPDSVIGAEISPSKVNIKLGPEVDKGVEEADRHTSAKLDEASDIFRRELKRLVDVRMHARLRCIRAQGECDSY